MTEIIIPKSITPVKLDELYYKYLLEQTFNVVSVRIPGSINKYTFGILAELLKFIITLNSKSSIAEVILDIDKKELDDFYDQEYSYPIVSLLWNTSIFLDKNSENIKNELRERQNAFFFRMNSLEKMKGSKYILINTDHLSKSSGLVRLFENANGFNDDEAQIKNSVKRILNNYVLILNKNNKSEFEEIVEDVGAIVYELVKNTYEWGKTDRDLIEIPASIRGVYFRFHVSDSDKIVKDFENTPIEEFFKHRYILENCINDQNRIYYLEMLVFDSGVGFIDRFLPSEQLNDIDIIKKCLVKNQTSSTSNLKSKKGIGLDRILNILNLKGLLRISTDKYCVYRDLIKDKYEQIDVSRLQNLKLEDWKGKDFKIDDNIKSQGTYISILYPFKSYR